MWCRLFPNWQNRPAHSGQLAARARRQAGLPRVRVRALPDKNHSPAEYPENRPFFNRLSYFSDRSWPTGDLASWFLLQSGFLISVDLLKCSLLPGSTYPVITGKCGRSGPPPGRRVFLYFSPAAAATEQWDAASLRLVPVRIMAPSRQVAQMLIVRCILPANAAFSLPKTPRSCPMGRPAIQGKKGWRTGRIGGRHEPRCRYFLEYHKKSGGKAAVLGTLGKVFLLSFFHSNTEGRNGRSDTGAHCR